jgi:hypothetical protein
VSISLLSREGINEYVGAASEEPEALPAACAKRAPLHTKEKTITQNILTEVIHPPQQHCGDKTLTI